MEVTTHDSNNNVILRNNLEANSRMKSSIQWETLISVLETCDLREITSTFKIRDSVIIDIESGYVTK